REAIIVSEHFSTSFVSELLDEYFNDLLESIVSPLPLLSVVNAEFEAFPTEVLTAIPPDELAREYSTETEPETPLSIPSLDAERLLVTRGNLRPFVTVSILKLRYYLSNTSLLEVLARFLDTSLIALKQKVAGKEPAVWLSVTKTIIDKRKEIDAMRNVSIDVNFYHAAWLLRRLLESQIKEAEQKRKDSENRQLDLEAISMAVKESPEGWMEQDQLSRTLETLQDKYGDSFDSFREEFYERYVHSHGKNSLPKVVLLENRYIHRDRVFPLLHAYFREQEEQLKLTFLNRMETQLRTGNVGGDTSFVDLDSFEAAILQEIRRQNAFLAALIEKPAVLAEGMILHAKQNKLVKDVAELKQRLSVYFNPESMKPLPLYEWFNLRLIDIFEIAFERLPILRRIWIRLTGKYESFRSRYVSQSAIRRQEHPAAGTGASRPDPRHDLPEPGSARGRRPQSASAQGVSRNSRRSSGGGDRGESRRSSAQSTAKKPVLSAEAEARKRAYTKKQVDSAWQEFGTSIKKDD
nr:hypothetical protein [Spirochaeta sp.]